MNCIALPTTDPHASSTASRESALVPKMTSVAIIAMFQSTGAVYESRKR